jgi:hypothetical protein
VREWREIGLSGGLGAVSSNGPREGAVEAAERGRRRGSGAEEAAEVGRVVEVVQERGVLRATASAI